mgnify:CR=1 FL=1
MKPTNYHLFDFLDFDPDLSRDESLWKAYKPTSVYEKDGDICINVPFQKQVLSNDMAPRYDIAPVKSIRWSSVSTPQVSPGSLSDSVKKA